LARTFSIEGSAGPVVFSWATSGSATDRTSAVRQHHARRRTDEGRQGKRDSRAHWKPKLAPAEFTVIRHPPEEPNRLTIVKYTHTHTPYFKRVTQKNQTRPKEPQDTHVSPLPASATHRATRRGQKTRAELRPASKRTRAEPCQPSAFCRSDSACSRSMP
jgi:hypothetical protein